MLHVVHAEQLLEAHAADTGHGIQTGQSQCGNAHGHKDGSGISGDTEHLKETGDAAAEDLEGSTGGGGAVSSGSSTGNAESQNSQQALEDHGAIATFSISFSFSTVLEEVPEETRLWKPETAPQATVTNRMGNMVPSFSLVKPVKTGRFMVG